MIDPDHPALQQIRALCLALPEVTERLSHGTPTFFAGKRSFLSIYDNHHSDGRLALVCAAPMGVQQTLVQADPVRLFVPPYVGHLGWIGVRLDRDLTASELRRFVEDAHAVVLGAKPAHAPRRKKAKPAPRR